MQLKGFVMPRSKVQAEVMQTATDREHSILEAAFPIADEIFDYPVAFDAADGVFHPDPQRGQPLVNMPIEIRQRLPARFLLRLQDGDFIYLEALKARILREFAPWGELILAFVGQFFVMFLAFYRRCKKDNPTLHIDQDIIFDRVLLFLAAVVLFLLLGVAGALNWAFRTIVKVINRRLHVCHGQVDHLADREFA